MTVKKLRIDGLLLIEPNAITDPRGYFFESYKKSVLDEFGVPAFVQDNESMSSRGVVRGLHLQAPPHAQAKLVRVARGTILDVAVDLRTASPTYGQHEMVELSAENKRSLYIPKGFAHGFICLDDHTTVQYKCSAYYDRGSEIGLLWNDPDLAITWPQMATVVSDKDKALPLFSDFQSPF